MPFRERFIEEMDANTVVRELKQQDIISQGERDNITKNCERRQQNEDLFACLMKNCTKKALMRACGIIIQVEGNPLMKQLGIDMKGRLETRQCKCAYK